MNWQDRIKKVEALIAGGKTDGEREAAALAKSRILERMQEEQMVATIEYTVPLRDPWQKKLFVAICHKYQLRTYRYRRQKHTTAMVRTTPQFMDNVLVPEFRKYVSLLVELVEGITSDIIAKVHEVKEEEIVIAGELSTLREAAL